MLKLLNFENMNISDNIKKSLKSMRFTEPTAVQSSSIPVIMQSKDVIIRSKTGSGKTAAYMIPIMNFIENIKGNYAKSLILLPTRELALQTLKVADRMTRFNGKKSAVVYGGTSYEKQLREISGADLIIGTPGRILDLINQKRLNLSKINFLVLDEADLMFDMGFIDDIKKIIKHTPENRQTILLSATMPQSIKSLAVKFMNKPEYIISGEKETIPESIRHMYTISEKYNKFSTLLSYLNEENTKKSIIFVKTQKTGNLLNSILDQTGFKNILIHGGMKQRSRERAINDFRHMEHGTLVATNVAARGLDIADVTDIVNFDAPDNIEVYTHRVGRSGRMGRNGRALTIFDEGDTGMIRNIQKIDKINMEKINIPVDERFIGMNFGKMIKEYRRHEEDYADKKVNTNNYHRRTDSGTHFHNKRYSHNKNSSYN